MDKAEELIEFLNQSCRNTLIDHLGIEFTEVSPGKLKARMPVDHRTIQPMGILHGGSVMALAETVGSAGSFVLIDREKSYVVGLEINGNHIGNTGSGFVTAAAQILHQGKTTHVWDIRIHDDLNRPISVCRLTNMIIDRKDI